MKPTVCRIQTQQLAVVNHYIICIQTYRRSVFIAVTLIVLQLTVCAGSFINHGRSQNQRVILLQHIQRQGTDIVAIILIIILDFIAKVILQLGVGRLISIGLICTVGFLSGNLNLIISQISIRFSQAGNTVRRHNTGALNITKIICENCLGGYIALLYNLSLQGIIQHLCNTSTTGRSFSSSQPVRNINDTQLLCLSNELAVPRRCICTDAGITQGAYNHLQRFFIGNIVLGTEGTILIAVNNTHVISRIDIGNRPADIGIAVAYIAERQSRCTGGAQASVI